MNRREFLCLGAACLLGVADGQKIVEASYYEPMIYKRFFQFTEYEERPVTDALVIHHTGFPNVDSQSPPISVPPDGIYE